MNNRTEEQGTEEGRKPRAEGVKQMNRRTIEQMNREQRKAESLGRKALSVLPLALCFFKYPSVSFGDSSP